MHNQISDSLFSPSLEERRVHGRVVTAFSKNLRWIPDESGSTEISTYT
ncbi:hypothetical protein LEP1GSC058_4016 [Leptospira fainei serovar Hurstbridge str. BUT 6]|uniref:Uncharacterized protein n=1 Tax=Leptospira fainei serovar Hurstbridge str. BUT 6 TaxID=1193011 RepID=S3UYI8_9LEPT|nr:hypothetical protein LEP1GSC058_4016 [Leptospira fainei serovar Hurstbridge str. BUT 6]